ncbi:hypothetical protein C9J12_13205 [Photobacterium frigidiphilum]|uniref:Uncharacterized protein n=1 Tax=Photobacterium frigidiphilum TaxID=264736 RepID=A0A2T3JGV8_9GAMM|nr:hypothetical protein C9J12_13205 [Photobacterium frigidiphilum]
MQREQCNMLFNRSCPSCKANVNLKQVHRTFVERYMTRKLWEKYECCNCGAELFAHCTKAQDLELISEGKQVPTE